MVQPNTLVILTRFLSDSGKSDEEIKKLLGFDEQVPFEMDREYLRPSLPSSLHVTQIKTMTCMTGGRTIMSGC